MYSLQIEKIYDFSYVKEMKNFSADLLISYYINQFNDIEEKQLKGIIHKILRKEYNEIVNEISEREENGEIMTQEELNEIMQVYNEDFEKMLTEEINEFNKCKLNKIGDVGVMVNKQCVGIFKHTKPAPNVHRFTIDI